MAQFLCKIGVDRPRTKTLVKVCFSSRPLQIFLDKFQGLPGFRIQDFTKEDVLLVIKARMAENERMLQYMQSPNMSEQNAVQALEMEIAKRADGVFLWLRLVLDELLEEFRDGANLHELGQTLLTLPTDLESYYQRVLERIPHRYQEESRVMFEITTCAVAPLLVQAFMEAFDYASIENLADCRPSTRITVGRSLDRAERLIRSRSGGLIEITPNLHAAVQDQQPLHAQLRVTLLGVNAYSLQFIHQTVKTFLQRPDTRFSSGTAALHTHNGYTYILKFMLATIARIKGPLNDIKEVLLTNIHASEDWCYALMTYANLAEKITGKSQRTLLCQVEDRQIAYLFDSWRLNTFKSETLSYPLIDSLLSLAVVADLRLFLAQQYTTESARRSSTLPLLHLAVHECLRFRDNVFLYDNPDQSAIIKILLEKGADMNEVFDDKTVFQMLCCVNHGGETPAQARMIKIFLKRHQDPNVRINELPVREPIHWYTPLHVAAKHHNVHSVRCLLRYGATVNSFDGYGFTPLDKAFEQVIFTLRKRMRRGTSDAVYGDPSPATISLLLDHGAKCSCQELYDDHITIREAAILRDLGVDVDDRITNPPVLRSGLATQQQVIANPTSSMVVSPRETECNSGD